MPTNKQRLYFSASLAGPLVDLGFTNNEAAPFHAALELTLSEFTALASKAPGGQSESLINLIAYIVGTHASALNHRAAVLNWSKRKAEYDEDCAEWHAAEPDRDRGWRSKPMTMGQRFLIADTAMLLEIDIPEAMDRGQAADWIDANGGNNTLIMKGILCGKL